MVVSPASRCALDASSDGGGEVAALSSGALEVENSFVALSSRAAFFNFMPHAGADDVIPDGHNWTLNGLLSPLLRHAYIDQGRVLIPQTLWL